MKKNNNALFIVIGIIVLIFLLGAGKKESNSMWGEGYKVIERQKYGEFEFPDLKDYYYTKVKISVGGILGTTTIERSSTSIIVSTKDRERITATTKQRDKPTVYSLSDEEVIVEQRAYIRHNYYTEYEKNGRIKKKRNYVKGYTTLRYEINPEGRTILITFNFAGEDFNLFMDDIQFMKQVTQGSRKVWVKY